MKTNLFISKSHVLASSPTSIKYSQGSYAADKNCITLSAGFPLFFNLFLLISTFGFALFPTLAARAVSRIQFVEVAHTLHTYQRHFRLIFIRK